MATLPQRYEKYMSEDELKAKSEEIDLFHLDFDWKEFRKHGMRFPHGINHKMNNEHNKSSHNNSVSLPSSDTLHAKHTKTQSNKTFQHLLQEWKELNIKLNKKQHSSKHKNADKNCEKTSSDCASLNRLTFILHTYHNWCAIQRTDDHNDDNDENIDLSNVSMVDIIDNLSTYSQTALYNDYCHLLDYHSSKEDFWQFIHTTFTKCELNKCKLFMRNHRSREKFMSLNKRKSLFFGYDSSNDVNIIQFLDRVHTFLLHSDINIAEESTLYRHVIRNNEQQIEQKLRKFRDFRIKQQKELDKCQINLANNTKFVTEIDDAQHENDDDDNAQNENDANREEKHHISIPIMNNLKYKNGAMQASSNSRNTELNEYSFGATFKYWDHFSHKKVFCVPKYETLRDEMLNNRVFTVSEFQWNDTLLKAIQIKMSYKGQSLYAINRGGTNNHYSIPYKMPISLSHIMVVLFYCNFDSLQRKFKQQCRPTHKKESRQSLNERNSEIGHWFSLLKEVCWFYGQPMKPGDIFYHGINKTLLFTQFHARFRFPLSTTTSLKEASLFAHFHTNNKKKKAASDKEEEEEDEETDDLKQEDDDEGIIIELGYCELCFFIDVQMMSDFPAENEKLFFGADLAIQNIYYQNKSYKKFVSALTLFQSIINGRFFVDILKENKVYQQILLSMITNFEYKYGYEHASATDSSHTVKYNHDIPQYIQDLFEYFYLNQHYVWIIKSQLKYLEAHLMKYFVPFIAIQKEEQQQKHKKYMLNLAGDYDEKHQYIKSYPLKYCVEYIWNISGDDFERFKSMKNGEWINCAQEFVYNINPYEYEDTLDEYNQHNDEIVSCFAIFQCSCAPSKTGKHSFFMKVNRLSDDAERILFGVDLYCPSISFKTSVPRRWFKQSDYLGYTMFDSEKLTDLKDNFEWHIAIKIYDYKKKSANR